MPGLFTWAQLLGAGVREVGIAYAVWTGVGGIAGLKAMEHS
jgi:multidrug transporter EmrE-like cation transporter